MTGTAAAGVEAAARSWAAIALAACAVCGCLGDGAVSPLPRAGEVRVVRVPAGGALPYALVDPAGVVHAVWVRGADVWYASSRDGGATWGFPSRVSGGIGEADEAGMFRGPSLCLGRGGRLHAAWYPVRRDRPGSEWGVRYAHADPPSYSWSLPLALSRAPSDGISVSADGTGTVVASWIEEEGLRIARSADGGSSFGAPEAVPGTDAVRTCATRALFLAGGELLLLYRDRGTSARRESVVAWTRGMGVFERRELSGRPWPEDACPTAGGWISAASGGAVGAWETGDEVTWAFIDGRGRILPPGEVRTMAAGGRWPVAVANAAGRVCVSWKESGTLFWQVFGPDGAPEGPPRPRSSLSPHGHAAAVLPDGTFVLVDAG